MASNNLLRPTDGAIDTSALPVEHVDGGQDIKAALIAAAEWARKNGAPVDIVNSAELPVEHFEPVRYHPASHNDFIFGTFSASSRRPFYHLARAAFQRRGVAILVARPIGGDELCGWIAAIPGQNRIIYAYTKHVLRGNVAGGEDGQFRIGSTLAIAAGIDFRRPVPCTFWSRAARKIAAKPGNPYSLFHSPEVFT
jgi:hypothetical protein